MTFFKVGTHVKMVDPMLGDLRLTGTIKAQYIDPDDGMVHYVVKLDSSSQVDGFPSVQTWLSSNTYSTGKHWDKRL